MHPAIGVCGLVKTFGTTRALDGLDLRVEAGEVHGLLGPNGAGKTTALRLLLGLLRADAGEMTLLGRDPWSNAIELHRHVAYVPAEVTLWPNLTGGEIIDMLGGLRGGLDTRRHDELVDRFDLDPTKKADVYSTGNRQKVILIPALASAAEVLILDEPTSGLDPLMLAEFHQCITEATEAGRTVLLSSHILADVESLADRVSIMRAGKLVTTGTFTELRALTHTTVRVRTDQPLDQLPDLPGVHDVQIIDGETVFELDTEHVDQTMRHLASHGIQAVTARPSSLEQIFLRHYQDATGHDHTADHVEGASR